MAQYGYPDLKIEVDDSGSQARDVSLFVTSINGVNIEEILQEITAAGDAQERWIAITFQRMEPLVLGGPHDDAALSLFAITRDALGDTRTVKVTIGGSVTIEAEMIIQTNNIGFTLKAKHEYSVTLQPTGTITVA